MLAPIQYSIVLPVFNEDEGLFSVVEEVVTVMRREACSFEVIIVDDGSTDGTWAVINQCCTLFTNVKAIRFSRNFGHQLAVCAGIQRSSGNAVAVMDSDGQDPPEMLPEMFAALTQGYDVVNGIRRKRKESIWKRILYRVFYRIYRRFVPFEIALDSGDFSAINRKTADVIASVRQHSPFIRGIRNWVGGNQYNLPYERKGRQVGVSKYSLAKLFSLALTGITAFSKIPLRLSIVVGFLISFTSLAYACIVVGAKLFLGYPQAYPGWASLAFLVAFLGGMQLVVLGIIGEYIGHIYDAVKGLPPVVVKEEVNFEDTPANS